MAQLRRSCGSCVLLVAALVAAACGARPTEPEDPDDYPCMAPDDDVGNRDLQDDPDYFWSVDDEYAALAREVPGGFGGMFEGEYRGRGEPGKTNFYLLDLSLAAEATTALGGTVAT
nr:hypothetical protein [Gemmatimonadota bacterium]NIQ55082.1 hypothetical protein [Gemmatimonadota bacterium]NIU75267.1 hypothetical protein [Gammaproteobacteria bacterium]NIX45073.1 hypothetical protein [Gemmatimonadota bacterium]NIY09313.1 hypothetical protein [Gemmatimonadota bacterium]